MFPDGVMSVASEVLPYEAKENEEVHSFTNVFGERWAIVLDHNSGKGVLLGDEVGWELEKGLPLDNMPKGFLLSSEELNWVLGCLDRSIEGALNCVDRN